MEKGREGIVGEMERWMCAWTVAWRMDGDMEGWSSPKELTFTCLCR